MGKQRRRVRPEHSDAVEENVQVIRRWEKAILQARSKAEQVSGWIAETAGSGQALVFHALWFGAWVTVNAGVIAVCAAGRHTRPLPTGWRSWPSPPLHLRRLRVIPVLDDVGEACSLSPSARRCAT
jgi:hypothetical protein